MPRWWGSPAMPTAERSSSRAPDDLDAVDFSRPVYFLAQTTQSLALFHRMADIIRERTRCPESVTIRDTICRQVSSREAKLREFAGEIRCGHLCQRAEELER